MMRTNFFALILIGAMLGLASPAASQTKGTPDFSGIRDVQAKKKAFFDFLRPIVEQENARILEQRKHLLKLYRKLKKGRAISPKDTAWLGALAKEYRTPFPLDGIDSWNELLSRVDIVPLELVLAQAAKESSWGASRFAREGHNFFGQWCFRKGCGMVPDRRNPGAWHEVAVFSSVQLSVRSYMNNINTGHAYATLRRIRARHRQQNAFPDALEMADGLIGYSERREAYVREIRTMIRINAKLMRGDLTTS